MDNIVALKEQCLVGRYGKRVGEAVPAALPDIDTRSPDEIVGYDETGMWR